jgi:hypothetical protein
MTMEAVTFKVYTNGSFDLNYLSEPEEVFLTGNSAWRMLVAAFLEVDEDAQINSHYQYCDGGCPYCQGR